MRNNRFILMVAFSLSLLVNIPRIVFFLGKEESFVATFLDISIHDTLFRILSVFGFSFLILKLHVDWIPKRFQKRSFLISSSISFLVLIVWMKLFKTFDIIVNAGTSSTLSPKFNTFIYIFVMIMLFVISRTITLFNQSKKDALEKEQLKQQSLHNELAALKNQVNPHFLFNTLNSLSLVIREDQNAAIKFINKLSFLYRYMLQSKNQDLITIKEELKFLESYIFLIKQRYRDNIQVNISIKKECYQRKIPTLALQFLLENAVKHNEISKNKPLVIEVLNDIEAVIVKNKLQKRTGFVESTHMGLTNLNSRFKLLTNKEIIIQNDKNYFTVKIPLL
ncbi:histidine kinase [Mariniflexile litorale]|uniref:Histidine kinase n=1 Tax=Mariniflexile litorale TaxID=3045158 RepID=A0AAU7EEI6_9FLAO|nr:histidine kinase [Mariniflexile sp. KMM 9835]MDQ8212010.1 histidine kinase [Mariniflexile sp. KMM 9835]